MTQSSICVVAASQWNVPVIWFKRNLMWNDWNGWWCKNLFKPRDWKLIPTREGSSVFIGETSVPWRRLWLRWTSPEQDGVSSVCGFMSVHLEEVEMRHWFPLGAVLFLSRLSHFVTVCWFPSSVEVYVEWTRGLVFRFGSGRGRAACRGSSSPCSRLSISPSRSSVPL